MRYCYTLFVAFLLVVTSAASAQSPDTTEADSVDVQLPEVMIEAARNAATEAEAPLSVSVHERSSTEIALEAPVFLRETFRDLPGVWMNDRGHFALGERLVVRGMGWRSPFGVRGVQVLLDGIPLTLPDGQAFMDVADPLFVRRAELIRGPSSLFWGNGSGGVLFLNTLPSAQSSTAQVRAGIGSFGLQQLAGEVVLGQPDTQLGQWRVAVSDMRRDGYRDNSKGRFTRGLLSGELTLTSRTQMTVVGAVVDQDARNPGSLTRDEMEDDPSQASFLFDEFNAGKQSTQAQLGVNVTHEFASASVDGTLYGGYRDLENPLPFTVIAFDRLYGGGRATVQTSTGPIEWNVGVDAGFQRDDRQNFATDIPNRAYTDSLTLDQLEKVVSTSVFAYAQLPITDRLQFTVGGRGDQINFELDDHYLLDGVNDSGERNFSAFSPGVGLSYDLGSSVLFANYNTAFETPTTTELVNRPGQIGGFNSDLSPQKTHGFEVGSRGYWSPARLEYDVALYHLSVDDRLVAFDFPKSDRTYFQNVGQNRHQGLEVALQWNPQDWLSLQTSYSANRSLFEDDALEDNRVPGVPEHRLYAEATGRLHPFWLRPSIDAVSDYYANNANTAVSEGYTLVNIRAGLQDVGLESVTIQPYAEVSNLFDTQYNGSVSINAGDNFFEPGAGRAYKLGATVRL